MRKKVSVECLDRYLTGISTNNIPELNDRSLLPPFDSPDRSKRVGKVRRALLETGGCWCYLCGDRLSLEHVTLDHVIPKAQGGRAGGGNLMICCKRCNCNRATMDITYFRMLRGFVMGVEHNLEMKQFTPWGFNGNGNKSKDKRTRVGFGRLTKIISNARDKV